MGTRISDLIIPEVVSEVASALIIGRPAIVNSGIAVQDYNNVDIREGGEFFKVPFWNEVSGDDEVLQEETPLTPGKITMGQDIGVVCHRGKAWSASDLAKIISGEDPNRQVAEQMANYWAKRYDAALLAVLKGVFSGPLKDTHVLDRGATAEADYPRTVKVEDFVDAMSLLGDEMGVFTAIIMHSKVYADLQKQGLITFGQTVMGQRIIETGEIPTFMGRRVVVNDNVPVETYTVESITDAKKYTTFISAPGVMYFGFQRELQVEVDRDILSFEDYLSTSVHFGAHLKGVKWAVTTTNPDNATLSTGTNWAKVFPDKAIKIVALKTN